MKKYFLWLLVWFVSFIWFSYWIDFGQFNRITSITVRSGTPWHWTCSGFCCFSSSSSSYPYRTAVMFNNEIQILPQSVDTNSLWCVFYSWDFTLTTTNSAITLLQYNFVGSLPSTSCPTCPECEVCEECPTCPVYSLSLAPLDWSTEYYSITWNVNVVVNEWIDYALDSHNNALWLSVWMNTDIWWQCTGDVIDPGSWNWSALYINWIQHESASLIDINIADYVPWDYSINEDVFDLDVGSGYDQDYIDWVIDVQSYRPTSEDFTQTFVWGLILFTPYVVILLFVILVWNLIKKIFKTK